MGNMSINTSDLLKNIFNTGVNNEIIKKYDDLYRKYCVLQDKYLNLQDEYIKLVQYVLGDSQLPTIEIVGLYLRLKDLDTIGLLTMPCHSGTQVCRATATLILRVGACSSELY